MIKNILLLSFVGVSLFSFAQNAESEAPENLNWYLKDPKKDGVYGFKTLNHH